MKSTKSGNSFNSLRIPGMVCGLWTLIGFDPPVPGDEEDLLVSVLLFRSNQSPTFSTKSKGTLNHPQRFSRA
jgi:hypothetical protein